MDDKIRIYVVSHVLDEIKSIKTDDLYIPLFVGRNGKESYGFLSDDKGDEISSKNLFYSELTGLYWIWKNTKSEIIGLCHYRRYLKSDNGEILEKEDIEKYLNTYDILLPKKSKLVKGSYWEGYKTHPLYRVLRITRNVIQDMFPNYLETFDKVLNQDEFHNYNIFISKKKLADDYCSWIFTILNEVENRIDINDCPRVLGLVSEAIFNVWIEYNNLNIKELDVYYFGFSLKLRMSISNNKYLRKIFPIIYNKLLSEKTGHKIEQQIMKLISKL